MRDEDEEIKEQIKEAILSDELRDGFFNGCQCWKNCQIISR
jgi:hypothetical protein